MQLTNKKIAFYIALILAGLVFALLIVDILTLAQAQLALVTIGMACVPFGLADVIYDYLGLMVKIGEQAAAATPSLEDDKKVAEFKAILQGVRQEFEKASKPLIDPAIKARIEAPVTPFTNVSGGTTPIVGTNFSIPIDETDSGNG